MFSALKKLTIKQDSVSTPPNTAGHPMSGSLQKRFSRGVDYNMKIIIKGDRNVGKSCLLQRLQGGGFIESYTPTEEIQVASIQWSFKATEDIVKVEVWDVVDRGKARLRHTGLKLSTGSLPETPALDAEFLDVYKGTHGVILMMDVTKAWTFEYVTQELPKVPSDIPVLVLGNHCDMSHHRVISTGQASSLIETVGENRQAEVLYAESSMRNGFGLRLLHKFLGLPFLRLQKETLLALLERNKRDTEICGFEINEFLKSDDADYNMFLNNLSNKRRQIAESNSRVPTTPSLTHSASSTSISSQRTPPAPNQQEFRPTKSIIVGGGQPIIIPGQVNITQQHQQKKDQNSKSSATPAMNKLGMTIPSFLDIPQKELVSALLKKSPDRVNDSDTLLARKKLPEENKIISVEEFCPDEGILDRSFLEDVACSSNDLHISGINNDDSDSDNATENPMVARFNDEPEVNDNDEHDSVNTMNTDKSVKLKTVNPLVKHRKSSDFSCEKILIRKFSISSEEIPVTPAVYESPSPPNEDSSDNWLPETSIRRSPEGGEDTCSIPSSNQDLIAKQNDDTEILVGKLEKRNSSSKHKKKKDKKDKEDKKEKKKKRRSKEIDLEEFLNGTASMPSRIDEGAYEAI